MSSYLSSPHIGFLLKTAPLLLFVLLLWAGCGGATQPPPQGSPAPPADGGNGGGGGPAPSPPPSQPAVEVVYVGAGDGSAVAFTVTEGGEVQQRGEMRIAGRSITRLRVTPDGRRLFAGAGPRDEGSVFFAAVDGKGGFSGPAREVADESADFELSPGGRFLFTEERIFSMEDEENIENRSIIRSYALEGSGDLTERSQLTLELCAHLLCDHFADLLGATESGSGGLLWVQFLHVSHADPSLSFRPLRASASGELQDGEDAAGHEGAPLAGEMNAQFLVSSAQDCCPPFLHVYRVQGAGAQRVDTCVGELGEPAEHDLCRRVVAVALRSGEQSRIFVANDGRAEVWSAALGAGGIDRANASMASAAAPPRELKVSPSGRFLFAIAPEGGALMGFRIRGDGALEPLAGSPWPLPERPTALTIAPAQP